MTEMIRKLSIVFSIACGVASLLLLALWMRSYWYEDSLAGPSYRSGSLHFHSEAGWLTLTNQARPRGREHWRLASQDIDQRNQQELKMFASGATIVRTPPRFGLVTRPFSRSLQTPHWFPLLLLTALAALPWIAPRFSLRTLLIALTLIAATMGFIVWARR